MFGVVQSGLQDLIICLDGADQETISEYRRGAKFSDIVGGFRLIYEAKKELKSTTPIVELQFILDPLPIVKTKKWGVFGA